MKDQKHEKSSIKTRILAILILIPFFFYMGWLDNALKHMDLSQRPLYTAIYLCGFLFLDILCLVVLKNDNQNVYDSQALEKASRFGRWYARYEDAVDIAFLLEFFYFGLLVNKADIPYFGPKYWMHIIWGIWLFVSTTVAVCGYFALRNVPKIQSDIELEHEEKREDGFVEISDENEAFKVLKWLVFVLRYGASIVSLTLWL